MLTCLYKKTFLKDLAKLPSDYRKRVEKLVFKDIPQSDSILEVSGIKKMKGYQDYYRIKMGDYRIGCKVEKESHVTFYRVKSRGDIYKVFP